MAALFTSQIRVVWAIWECATTKMVRHSFPGEGRTWRLPVASGSTPAWEAFTALMNRHGYLFRESAGGTFNCRHTNHDPSLPMSLHSYGVAIDLNPSKNPQGTRITDMPDEFVADVKGLRCGNGQPVFRWGGDWKGSVADPMHWQLACSPSDLVTGVEYEGVDMDPELVKFVEWLKNEYEAASNPAFDGSVAKAVDAGVFSEHTQDEDVVTASKLAVFLDRAGVLDATGGTVDLVARTRIDDMKQNLRRAGA